MRILRQKWNQFGLCWFIYAEKKSQKGVYLQRQKSQKSVYLQHQKSQKGVL